MRGFSVISADTDFEKSHTDFVDNSVKTGHTSLEFLFLAGAMLNCLKIGQN